MDTCKARKCIRNPDFNHILKGWNSFKRCNKKVYQNGFCKTCYSKDRRTSIGQPSSKKPENGWPWKAFWERDGIYGVPYHFPYHVTDDDKKWVEKIYQLHPEIKPKEIQNINLIIEANQRQLKNKIQQWLDKYSDKIDYKMGKELEEILSE